ncbi:MAG: hypothetical protein WCB62_25705, partial [Pseudolabrys sp.]
HWGALRRSAADGQFAPLGGHTRHDFEPKVSGSGSQLVLLFTIMNGNGGADAVINGGLNTVLMVRRRDPRGSRRVAREFERTFESM